jgi:hypothetical protein
MRHVWNFMNPSRLLLENVFFIPKKNKIHHLVEHFGHFGRFLSLLTSDQQWSLVFDATRDTAG